MSTEVLFQSTQEGAGVVAQFARSGDEKTFFDLTAGTWKFVFKQSGNPRLFLVIMNCCILNFPSGTTMS